MIDLRWDSTGCSKDLMTPDVRATQTRCRRFSVNDTHPVCFGVGLTLNIEGNKLAFFQLLGDSDVMTITNIGWDKLPCFIYWGEMTPRPPQQLHACMLCIVCTTIHLSILFSVIHLVTTDLKRAYTLTQHTCF